MITEQAQAPLGHACAEPVWRKAERTLGSAAVGQRAGPAAGPKLLVVPVAPAGPGAALLTQAGKLSCGDSASASAAALIAKTKSFKFKFVLGNWARPGRPTRHEEPIKLLRAAASAPRRLTRHGASETPCQGI